MTDMSWYRWKWWIFAYAPEQTGINYAHGYSWSPLAFGLYYRDTELDSYD